MKAKILFFIWIAPCWLWAQSDSTLSSPSVKLDGFVDAFYSYDFAEPVTNMKQPFFYNHNRHNELSINLALIRAQYTRKGVRGAIGLMAGTYAEDNLAHEQGMMRNIFEAWGGIELVDDLWLEAGVFGSHLGFESAISTDNITLTRSLMAENSPYYLSGAKLVYEGVDKWTFLTVVSNGWQNISEPWFNENKAIGTQVVFEPSDKLLFNYSTMVSDEASRMKSPLRPQGLRLFNDLYMVAHPTERISVITAFDLGMEWYDNQVGSSGWNVWYAPAVLVGYEWHEKFATGVRAEYYSDENQVIIGTGTPNGFQVLGTSLNLDYQPVEGAKLRLEGKWLNSQDPIFLQSDFSSVNNNFAITTSLAVMFGK